MTQAQIDLLRQFADLNTLSRMAKVFQAQSDEATALWRRLLDPWLDYAPYKTIGLTTGSDDPSVVYLVAESQHTELRQFSKKDWVDRFFRDAASLSDKREKHRQNLFGSNSDEEVLDILEQNYLHRCIKDYLSYSEYRLNYLEDDERPGIILHSLQSWAWFLIDCAKPLNLPYAKISADFHGCVELEWELSGNTRTNERASKYWGPHEGIAILRFYPSRMHAFSILSGSYASGKTPHNF